MQNFSQIYVLSSDEPFLKNDFSSKLTSRVKENFKDRPEALDVRIYTASDFGTSQSPKLASLENELIDPGFFIEFKIIKIYLKDLDALSVAIFNSIAKINPKNVLLIIDLPRINSSYVKVEAKDINAKKQSSKITLETKKKNAIAYLKFINANINVLYPPDEKELPQFIINRAKSYNLSLDNNAIDLLVSLCEGNLSLIDQTLNIMTVTLKTNFITEDIIENYFSKDSRYTIYDFTSSILNLNSARALNILNSLCNDHGSQKGNVIYSLIRELEKTFNCIKEIQNKKLFHMQARDKIAFFASYQIMHPKSQESVLNAAKNMPLNFFMHVTYQIAKASAQYSNFKVDEAYLTLQNIAIMMTNINSIVNLREL